jgi:hypothetical protein
MRRRLSPSETDSILYSVPHARASSGRLDQTGDMKVVTGPRQVDDLVLREFDVAKILEGIPLASGQPLSANRQESLYRRAGLCRELCCVQNHAGA